MISPGLLREIDGKLAYTLPLLGPLQRKWERLYESLPQEEREALRFLCAAAPLSDLAACPPDTLLDFARHGVWLYRNLPACRALPEPVFLHFVLHHRVNNEGLEPCRARFHQQLSGLVGGQDACADALVVNAWCARQVTYRLTDERTASALHVYCNGFGRCGEESVFAVNALRSVGIPARQVYAPHWSHCDDNHAWVEVWCGGVWHFLGACEPEAALDQGWFVNAASRAMLVHFPVFGPPSTGELEADHSGCAVRCNALHRYADTRRLEVHVRGKSGAPAVGARIDCEVLNYAQMMPIATLYTDSDGRASIETGKGSLHLCVCHGGTMRAQMVEPDTQRCEIVLEEVEPETGWRKQTMWPPPESAGRVRPLDEEQRRRGRELRAEAERARAEKREQFCSERELEDLSARAKNPAAMRYFLRASAGNYQEIRDFWLAAHAENLGGLGEQLLGVLSEKDLTDNRAAHLLEHLCLAAPFACELIEDVFVRYVLCPRVAEEPPGPYRAAILAAIPARRQAFFRRQPERLWRELCEPIRCHKAVEYPGLITPPTACLLIATGSERSRRVLFVAACRSLGIPARLRLRDGAPEYYRDGAFRPVLQEPPTAELSLRKGDIGWRYGSNWSLARLEDGRYRTMRIGDDESTLSLPPGDYRVITTNRLPNGVVWGAETVFSLTSGEQSKLERWLREPDVEDMLQLVPLQQGLPPGATGAPAVWLWLCPGEEPTCHVLGELLEQRELFAVLGSRLTLLLAGGDADHPQLAAVRAAFPQAVVFADGQRESGRRIARRMYLEPDTLPLLLVTDARGNGVYASCGYNVGAVGLLGDVLALLANRIE